MYHEHQKLLLSFPKSLVTALCFVLNYDILISWSKKITFVYKVDEIVCKTCAQILNFIILWNYSDEYKLRLVGRNLF